LQLKPLDLYSYYEYETVEELPVVPPPTTLTFAEDREIKVSYVSILVLLPLVVPFLTFAEEEIKVS
jgi:hypothetical protein